MQEHDIYVPEGMEPPVLHRARTTLPVLQPVHESKPLPQPKATDRLPLQKVPASSPVSPSQRSSPSGAASGPSDRSLRRLSFGSRGDRNGRSISASSLSSVEAAAILGLPPRSAFRKTPV